MLRKQRLVPLATCAIGVILMLGIASCSSSGTSTRSGGSGSSGASGSASGAAKTSAPTAASAAAVSAVNTAMKLAVGGDYTAPGPAVTGVSKLAGKTIWYIPLTSQITTTQLVQASLTAALATAGIQLHTCSGDTNPSTIAGCITSAANANAAGVIFDSITADFISNGIKQLEAAHIPVEISDEPNSSGGGPGTDQLSYVPGNPQQALSVVAQWIATDAGGPADVLVNEVTDAPPTIEYISNGFTPALKQACAGCTIAINKIQSANFSLMASSTSAALIANPSAKYVVSEFDAYAPQTMQGVQQAGRLSQVKGASMGGLLAQLQLLKAGTFLYADAGTNFAYQGWAEADEMLRQLTGAAPVSYDVPLRLFTRDNVKSLTLTVAAQDSGEWYGSTAFKSMFTKLWGR
jgi:ribose transport system substrate-binding protein